MNEFAINPLLIPFGGMLMVCIIVAIRSHRQTNEKEMQLRHELQLKEMEHKQKIKEMELELAKLEAAKNK